ncbi:MAG: DUF1653 domain-containing protein [Pseudomonadales bacterium]|jgi:hypothetical protein|nr:DUF1653 domain-containing protein [Pseudomonadales bacterium]
MNPIPLGRYRHYKGRDYSVLGFARHSETEEWLVLYVPLYGEGGYWVRPLALFTALVDVEGKLVPRFRLIDTVR